MRAAEPTGAPRAGPPGRRWAGAAALTERLRGGLAALAATLALPLAAPFLLANPKLRAGWRQRLGRHPAGFFPPKVSPRVWVHGASAGDIGALLPTLRALRALRPEVEVVASTLTASGHRLAGLHRELLAAVTYAPWDAPGPVRRTFAAIQPDLLVVEYTEMWPQMLAAARARGVPVVLHNGRLSPGRLRAYSCLFALTGNLLRGFSHLLMRHPEDAARARRLGARPEAVEVTGNSKDDALAGGRSPRLGDALARAGHTPAAPLWVAGSTHPGEEALIFASLLALRRRHPQLGLVVVPRDVHRAPALLRQAARRGLRAVLRSQLEGGAEPGAGAAAGPPLVVVDTVGELADWYAHATVAFVGGSLVGRGGQNMLEPAACGVPTVFGPHTHNFACAVALLRGRGGVEVADGAALTRQVGALLDRPAGARRLGRLARARVAQLGGAARRNAAILGRCLPPAARQQPHSRGGPSSPPCG